MGGGESYDGHGKGKNTAPEKALSRAGRITFSQKRGGNQKREQKNTKARGMGGGKGKAILMDPNV